MIFLRNIRSKWITNLVSDFIKDTKKVIDIGAGDCILTKSLMKTKNVDVVAVDRGNFSKTDIAPIILDGVELPFPDNHFDAALLIFVLHYVRDRDRLLAEAKRVAKNRIIIISDFCTNSFEKFLTSIWGYFANLGRASDRKIPFCIYESDLKNIAEKFGLKIIAEKNFRSLLSLYLIKHKLLVLEKK
ncbi:MAG: methyltransferase domain-containing protein [Candidatus Aenigmarchaeota archaeon]|nr:methyltransferase domain-containing protein [Candidatus Aenigmarchaeota archaeon]